MYDRFKRKINYLRISVTDRCNLRCIYCMSDTEIKLFRYEDILSFEEIVEIVKVVVKFGINKIRLTGGEPLVRKDIVKLVEMIAKIDGINDLAMTTNGILLKHYAKPLALAGLHRVNISLDTVNPQKYYEITHGGDITEVLDGIRSAKNAGLSPIKINCVVRNHSAETDAKEVEKFCKENNLQVRFIRLMNLETGNFTIVEHGDGGNCNKCNRIRLTANGIFKPCLFSNIGFSVRKLGIEEAFKSAIESKPEYGTINPTDRFYNVGG